MINNLITPVYLYSTCSELSLDAKDMITSTADVRNYQAQQKRQIKSSLSSINIQYLIYFKVSTLFLIELLAFSGISSCKTFPTEPSLFTLEYGCLASGSMSLYVPVGDWLTAVS